MYYIDIFFVVYKLISVYSKDCSFNMIIKNRITNKYEVLTRSPPFNSDETFYEQLILREYGLTFNNENKCAQKIATKFVSIFSAPNNRSNKHSVR